MTLTDLADRFANMIGYTIKRKVEIESLEHQISLLNDKTARLKRNANMMRAFTYTTRDYFSSDNRSQRFIAKEESVRAEFDTAWIPEILARKELIIPDICIFRRFTDPEDTVLDIGAHWGESAASIWASGCAASILSFEPNPMNYKILEQVKALRRGRYDFIQAGLGLDATTLRFVTPVINGVAVSALTSAVMECIQPEIIENLVEYSNNHISDPAIPYLQFLENERSVVRLDDVLRTGSIEVPLNRIVAIKIDVEGFEADVLAGGTSTLESHKPLLWIEGANRVEPVVKLLKDLGFLYADRCDETLVMTEKLSENVNGFFLHNTRLDEYRRIGLLQN